MPIYFALVALRNPLPWTITVEAMSLVDPTPGLTLGAAYLARPEVPPIAMRAIGPAPEWPPGQSLDQAYSWLPAAFKPAGERTNHYAQTLVVVQSDRPGPAGFSAVAVDYRVGPLTFRAVQHIGLKACLAPLPSDTFCPEA